MLSREQDEANTMMYTRPAFQNVSMLSIFCVEIEKQIVLLNDNLLALENKFVASLDVADSSVTDSSVVNNNSGTAQVLDSLMRSTHSIKGAARIVGLDAAVEVAHTMEDCLVAIKQGRLIVDSGCVDVLLAGVDWFAQLGQVKNDAQPEWLVQYEEKTGELLERLLALLSVSPTALAIASPVENEEEKIGDKKEELEDAADLELEANLDSQMIPGTTTGESVFGESASAKFMPVESARAVKVNADNLKQLMALAGESLVEANWLQPFTNEIQQLRQKQQLLTRLLDQLQPEVKQSEVGMRKLDAARQVALGCHELLGDRVSELDQFSRRFSQLSDNLYQEVIASHMRPFSDGVQGFPRMVRDLAVAEGKQVTLEIAGQATQIDREILDKLEAPLTHMLRNAIAHGIEPPAKRQQLGKPAVGTIRIEASNRAGMLSILVSDDGGGIDLEQLRASVVDKQLTSSVLAAQLSEAELMEFLFLPGFSTAAQVTELAGRGVGLDIAKNMVQEVGGLLRAVDGSADGAKCGLSFHFQLPLTLSVIRALVVDIAGEPYAFGLTRIDQVRLLNAEEISTSENRAYFVMEGENVSLVKAQQVLELSSSKSDSRCGPGDAFPVVIVSDRGSRYGIIVDRLMGERELVVRPLDERFGKLQDVSAAALTEEGWPLLILDVADLVCSIEQRVTGGDVMPVSELSMAQSKKARRILVVDDSLTVREMERQLLKNHGYQVDMAVNGMEGWNMVRTGEYDLVISDIDMPRMNGIELVERIKCHPQLKQLPVIIVSYKDRQSDQLAGLNAGADYYLTKSSFQDNSLVDAVRDLIA